MNKRVAFLLIGFMMFTNINMVFANDLLSVDDVAETGYPIARTTSGSITTTGGSITTTGGQIEIEPERGITDRVITTDKGTIEILDDGSIITTGDTTYNPTTGSFDIKNPHYTNYERIYIGGELEEGYGGKDGDMLRYGIGATINKNYSFICDNEVYTIDRGDIYTRWFVKDDDTNKMNIMPLLSFMEMDGKWFFFERSTVLYPRYTANDTIKEIVLMNQVAIRLEEDTVVINDNEERVLSKGSLLITTEGRSSYITDFGEIPKNTIVNYQDGSVELLHEKMYITKKNVNVRVQNINCDNTDIEFKPYIINPSTELPPIDNDVTEPPVNDNNTGNGSNNIDNEPSHGDNSDSNETIDTIQKLNKNKQYEYNVTGAINLAYKKEVIKLKKDDRIILPYGLGKIDKTLPYNTLIIRDDGERLILNGDYVIDRKLTFTESKDRYLAFIIYINNKPCEIVIRIK